MRINKMALAAAMAREDLNCLQLSALAGISNTTVSAIRGGKKCSAETARKLAAVLGNEIIEEVGKNDTAGRASNNVSQ